MRLPWTVLVAVSLVGTSLAQPIPGLQCYKVKDPQTKTTYTADVDGLIAHSGCTIKVPAAMACVPSATTNIAPTPPEAGGAATPNRFFCYKAKCPKAIPPPLTATDPFGSRTVAPSAARLLCAPLEAPTTTTTTATSTTTSTTAPCGVPATGQTTCWDMQGVVVACAGTGQDGDLKQGAPLAYVDNGDGTITDVNTGLMWEKQSRDGGPHDVANSYTWTDAFAMHIAILNGGGGFAGHNDWRVPNIRELGSILNYQNVSPAVSAAFDTGCTPGCAVLTCSCTGTAYWSSTSVARDARFAWAIDFSIGLAFDVSGTYNWKNGLSSDGVRAVRGPQ